MKTLISHLDIDEFTFSQDLVKNKHRDTNRTALNYRNKIELMNLYESQLKKLEQTLRTAHKNVHIIPANVETFMSNLRTDTNSQTRVKIITDK